MATATLDIIKEKKSWFSLCALVFLASFMLFSSFAILAPSLAHAEAVCTADKEGKDTDDFKIDNITIPSADGTPPIIGSGLISGVVDKIDGKLTMVTQRMFKSITHDSAFLGTLRAAMTLYIAIYGILFMAGIAEMKFHDFIVMLAKFAIVGALLSDTSWDFFNSIVVKFFNNGTNTIINEVTAISVGGGAPPAPGAAGAFGALDAAISKAISSKMIVTLLASLPPSLYGLLFGGMLLISLFLFMQSILTATWVYVMSLAMKTLLFGLAPIFIPFILFQRTKHLFDGWLSQVVSASIQPILLFIFLTFFVRLMDASMINILHNPVCWSDIPEGVRGSPFSTFYWRFMEKDDSGHWVPKTGENAIDADYPIPVVAILTFLILAYLANSFNAIVLQISEQISSGVNLSGGNPISEAMSKLTSSFAGRK